MTDQPGTGHEDGSEASWEAAYVMVVAILFVLMVCTFLYAAVATVTALIMVVASPTSLLESFDYAPSIVAPPLIILASIAAFATYLLLLWHYRDRLKRSHVYVFVAIGGAMIPIAISTSHFFNYSNAPASYVIPSEKLPYLRQLSIHSLRRAHASYRRLQDYQRLIVQLQTRRTALPSRLSFVEGPPAPGCHYLDLGPQTGALCAARKLTVPLYLDSTGSPSIIEETRIFLNLQGRLTDSSLDLATLFTPSRDYCTPTVQRPGEGGGGGADTVRLFGCLLHAQRAIEADLGSTRRRIERASHHPEISYGVILLDSWADIVDADYSVLEPVAPLAGFISVTGSLLTWLYFSVFAALVLEGVSRKRQQSRESAEQPAQQTARSS